MVESGHMSRSVSPRVSLHLRTAQSPRLLSNAILISLYVPPNPIKLRFFIVLKNFSWFQWNLCKLAFHVAYLVLMFVSTIKIFYWEGVKTEGIIIFKKFNYSLYYIGKNTLIYFSSLYRTILSCCKLELVQYKHFCKLATGDKQLSFERL